MTLELKRYKDDFFDNSTEPYRLGGVEDITNDTEYGEGYFTITIFDRRVFLQKIFNMLGVSKPENIMLIVESGLI